MSHEKITIEDSMSLTDKISVTSWLSPKLFKNEFGKYRDKYFLEENDGDLVMAYVLLQMYLENHFHYYLNFIIGEGFQREKLVNWLAKDYADEKLEKFRDFLSQKGFKYSPEDFEVILSYFRKISAIRNLFLHGHSVTQAMSDGEIKQSDAKKYLNRQKFNETRQSANEIVYRWNVLLCNLQLQTQLLRSSGLPNSGFFDNCKFEVF